MKNLRTKWNNVIVLGICLLLVAVSIGYGTRTITDTSDTVYTQIITSAGGVYDATFAGLQSAIYSLNASGGGEIKIPSCNITFTSTIYITSGVWLHGNGNSTVFYLGNAVNKTMIRNYDWTNGNDNIRITDLILEGNGLNQPEWWHDVLFTLFANGIYLKCCKETIINNVVINNTAAGGLYIERGFHNSITDCRFYNIGKLYIDSGNAFGAYGITALWLYNGTNSIISNCIINNSYSGGIIIESHFNCPNTYRDKNIIISDCIVSNTNYAYYFEDAKDCILTNCISYNYRITGGHPASSSSIYLTSSNITINGFKSYNSYNTIMTGGSDNIFNGVESYTSASIAFYDDGLNATFKNCKIFDSATIGIDAQGKMTSITDCTINGCGTNGIIYAASGTIKRNNPYSIISGNILENIGTVGIRVTTYNTSIINNIVNDSIGVAIQISGANYTRIIGNTIRQGGSIELTTCNKGTIADNFVNGGHIWDYGIVLTNSWRFNIYGNTVERSKANTPDYGITETGTSNYNFIHGNYINMTAANRITVVGANTIIRDNFGYVTENWGNTSITNNATISHGLASKPSFVDVNVFGHWNMTAHVTAITSTTFTVCIVSVTTNKPIGASTEPIQWYAKV